MKSRAAAILTAFTLLICSPVLAADSCGLYQISTIDALLDGSYDGQISFAELAKHGDFGLGTVDKLNGEMVGIDGKFYQITVDGKVHSVPPAMTTPFANVTFFKPSFSFDCPAGLDYKALQKTIDKKLPSANLFYAVRVDADFAYVRVRSVPGVTKRPYPKLVDIVKHQKVYEFKNVKGSLVGFYSPAFVKGVNVPGYHLHFIGHKRQKGGHLLGITTKACKVRVAVLNRLNLVLPTEGDFLKSKLGGDMSHQLEKVEKDRPRLGLPNRFHRE
jgi:acetolactate decarboxylase